MNYQASNPESLSETQKGLDKKWFTSSSSKETSSRSANFLHKLEQLDCLQDCGETVQFARASPGSDVIPRGGDRFTHYQTLYQSLPELRSRVKGTMDTADCTHYISTHDEGECWEEGLHSLSCSEDEDRGELVCTGLIFI